MGRKDGENAVPTVIGTAKTSVNAHPITAKRTGSSRARSNTAASIAPATAYVNATASMDTFVHAAIVGRERGRESPIPVSPAMATLAGRSAASIKLCTPGSGMAAPKAVPNIPYWTSRDASAPAIAPTRTKTKGAHNRVAYHRSGNHPPSPGVGGLQRACPLDLVAGCPLLHKAEQSAAGKSHHIPAHQHGDNGDGGRLDVVTRLLESDNAKRWNKVNRRQYGNEIALSAHEYLGPYRSHAHCQMRSMPRD